MATDYDDIAEDYKESKHAPWRIHAELWSLFELLGDVTRLRVLDLACGEGFYTRRIRQRGAARVLGVDVSRRMVELAQAEETQRPLGVEYVAADARELELSERFDVVVASYLLNYAATAEQLAEMARAIARHLVPGGRFVTINNNPAQPLASYPATRKYGFTKAAGGALREGLPVTYTCFLPDDRSVQFDNYYLAPETHVETLQEAGLRDVRWHPLQVSPEGVQQHGDGYWRELLEAQPVICLDASR